MKSLIQVISIKELCKTLRGTSFWGEDGYNDVNGQRFVSWQSIQWQSATKYYLIVR